MDRLNGGTLPCKQIFEGQYFAHVEWDRDHVGKNTFKRFK